MSVRTADYPARAINWRKLVAIIAQIASWFTTLWFVQWIWVDGPLPFQVLTAVITEALLVVLRERLFRGDDPALGWAPGRRGDQLRRHSAESVPDCDLSAHCGDRRRIWVGGGLHLLQPTQRRPSAR
jgi:hypothetical protein